MSKAIQISETGGPEVLTVIDRDVGAPGAGEVTLNHGAVGLNFIDIAHRRGAYPLQNLPSVVGMEAAGTVTAVGDGVSRFKVGDRVSHSMVLGAYSAEMNISETQIAAVPDGISDEVAAAATLQGLTAQYLLRDCYAVQPGDTVLVHAAAGGVGLILCQWAKHIGATVIGTVSTEEKAAYAKAHGADHTINYTSEDFAQRAMELTDGAGVNAVYDAIGKDTFEKGLDALADVGTLVTYGAASGPAPAVDLNKLGPKSLKIARGGLWTFIKTPERLDPRAADLWDTIQSGAVKIEINQRYALEDVAQAHADLEGRKTTGSTILQP